MRASRSKKPGVTARARAKRPAAMRARKAGANGVQRGAVKNGHAKPHAGSKPAPATARIAKPKPKLSQAAHKETAAAPVKKAAPAAGNGNGGVVAAARPEAAATILPPRGNPPPLPAPIASFNF